MEYDSCPPPPQMKKATLSLSGLTCASCVKAIEQSLQKLPGVVIRSITVNLLTSSATLEFNSVKLSIDQISRTVVETGYEVLDAQVQDLPPAKTTKSSRPSSRRKTTTSSKGSITDGVKKATLSLSGLTCASCVKSVEQSLEKLPGVIVPSININLLMSKASLNFDSSQVSIEQITKVITEAGYKVDDVSVQSLRSKSRSRKTPQKDIPLEKRIKITLDLSGLTSPTSVKSTEQALEKLPGVIASTISVNMLTSNAILQFDPAKISAEQISQTITDIGYEVNHVQTQELPPQRTDDKTVTIVTEDPKEEDTRAMSSVRLEVTGMTCASCVNTVKQALESISGVEYAHVNLLLNEANVRYDQNLTGPRSIIEKIDEIGFGARTMKSAADQQGNTIKKRAEREQQRLRTRFITSLWFAIPTFIIAMIFMTILPESNKLRMALEAQIIPGLGIGTVVLFLLATPVQFYLGYPFYIKAWRSMYYAHVANMDTLVAIGTTVSYLGSIVNVMMPIIQGHHEPAQEFFETSVFLITFVWLGRWMEAKAKGKTYETITKLMELQPETATLVTFKGKEDGVMEEREVDIDLIQIGDILKVNPGARIPCDGNIYRGTSTLDESMITGESIPVTKSVGDDVISATVNQSSTLWIKATRVGSDTTLSRIISLVQEAQSSKKAPIEELADKIAQVFVPAVISIAVLDFLVWLGLGVTGKIPADWVPAGQNYPTFALFFAVSVMVIACPCAMGLASPTAIMVGTGVAARLGILIKGGGEAIEMARRIDVIAFDKTGTLTYGQPKVVDRRILHGKSSNTKEIRQLLYKIIGLVESSSDHPLARAVTQFAEIYGGEELMDGAESPFVDPENTYLEKVTEVPGKGLRASVAVNFVPENFMPITRPSSASKTRFDIFVGNESWLEDNKCKYPPHVTEHRAKETLQKWKALGYSIVLVGIAFANDKYEDDLEINQEENNGMILVQFGVADTPRPDAEKTVAALRSRGIQVWMITGDNPVTAKAIADQLGIDKVLAEVTPEMKAKKIKWLQRRGPDGKRKAKTASQSNQTGNASSNILSKLAFWRRDDSREQRRAVVAMIGDGINDSPALAQSDLPISISSATDVAVESSTIILTRSTLVSLVTLVTLSEAIIRRIRLNFLWAYIYNTLSIPIATGIFFSVFRFALRPEIAGLAMAASSTCVVTSSLWLKRFKEPAIPEVNRWDGRGKAWQKALEPTSQKFEVKFPDTSAPYRTKPGFDARRATVI